MNVNVNLNRVEHLRFWCHKVLPLVYDDSLSYYELLCKVVAKLNEMADVINALPGEIDRVIKEYLENFEIPMATTDKLGGIRAKAKSERDTVEVKIDPNTGLLYVEQYTLPVAGADMIGGVKGARKTVSDTVPVHIDESGNMYVQESSYELPIASNTVIGGVKGEAKTENDTVPVHIDSEGNMYVPAASIFELQIASDSVLGGVKANPKTESDNVPVNIDPATGFMYVSAGSGDKHDIGDYMLKQGVDFDTAFDDIVASCNDGDTIYFKAGTYESSKSHTVNKAINLIGDMNGVTINIKDDGTYETTHWLQTIQRWLWIENINILDYSSTHGSLISTVGTDTTYTGRPIAYISKCSFECKATSGWGIADYLNIACYGDNVATYDAGYKESGVYIADTLVDAGTPHISAINIGTYRFAVIERCNIYSNTSDVTNEQKCIKLRVGTDANTLKLGYVRISDCVIECNREGISTDYILGVCVIERCNFSYYSTQYAGAMISQKSNIKNLRHLIVRDCNFPASPSAVFGLISSFGLYITELYGNVCASGSNICVKSDVTYYQNFIARNNVNLIIASKYGNLTGDLNIKAVANDFNAGTTNLTLTEINASLTNDCIACVEGKFTMSSNSAVINLNADWKPLFRIVIPFFTSTGAFGGVITIGTNGMADVKPSIDYTGVTFTFTGTYICSKQ